MKKIINILIILFISLNSIAQVNTNLVVSANPPSTLTQWSISRETLTYIVQPIQGAGGQYKIKTEIKLVDGTVVGRTDLVKANTYTLSSTTTIYNAADVIPMQYMIFNGKYKTSLEKSGKLPADNYQICVQLVRPIDFVPFSEERCRTFNLAAAQLPILLKPYNEGVINFDVAKTAIIFRWSPVSPAPKFVPTYKLFVFEVLPHQNPVQAMRSNFPILTQEIRGTTQYIWQSQGILNDIPNDTAKGWDGKVKGIVDDEATQRKGWDGTVKGGKKNSNDSMPTNPSAQRKGWDGTVKGKTAEDDAQIRKGWDGTVKGKKYVWTIQALDNLGVPLGDGNINGDGVSEPIIFFITRKEKATK